MVPVVRRRPIHVDTREPQSDIRPAAARSRLSALARLVSQIASPPCLGIVAVLLVAAHSAGSPDLWWWTVVYLALVLGPPLAYLAALYARGHVSDLDLSTREERLRPYLVAVAALALAAALLYTGGAPPLLTTLAAALALEFALLFAITLAWKISAHAAAAATLAALAVALASPLAPLWILLVPLVCWARVHLGRHTITQTIAGALLGAAVIAGVLTWSIAS